MNKVAKLAIFSLLFGGTLAPTKSNAVDWNTCNLASFVFFQWPDELNVSAGSQTSAMDVSGSQSHTADCQVFRQSYTATVLESAVSSGTLSASISGDNFTQNDICTVEMLVNNNHWLDLTTHFEVGQPNAQYAEHNPTPSEEILLDNLLHLGINSMAAEFNCPTVPSANQILSSTIQIVEPSSSEFTGITLNAGSEFTNSRNVKIQLSFEGFPVKVAVSNDGGFSAANSRIFDYSTNQIDWTLRATTSDRLPKTVYVKYKFRMGNGQLTGWSSTHSDEIILDTVAPILTIKSAQRSLSLAHGPSLTAGTTKIKLSAKDDKSGVRQIQLNTKKSSVGAFTRSFTSTLTTNKFETSKRLYVRVKDGAGNWSSWKLATVK